jgi:hypothetical protein
MRLQGQGLVSLWSLALSACMMACEGDETASSSFDPAPEIKNLLVDFGRYDSASGRAGPFPFDPSKQKMFYEFNAEVSGPGGVKLLPTFEYHLVPDAKIYAPASGYVTLFKHQPETGDYEIGISRSPELASEKTGMITVDHLTNLTVAKGDFVTAGQLLGNPGPWIEGVGKTELMVYENGLAYCPLSYMSDSLKAEYGQKIFFLMADWEAYKKDTTLYREASMAEPGCNGLTGLP